MEETIYVWRFCGGRVTDIKMPSFCALFKGATIRLTNERISVNFLIFPICEMSLSEITSIVVKRSFLWFKSVKVTSRTGQGIFFWILRPGVEELAEKLKSLDLSVQSD
jgi:hypothetical protein